MAEKVIFAMYDDDDKLMDGAKHLVANDVKVSDVYSPMPLHGIDSIIGIEPTRLAITAFMYGITGVILAMIGIRYMMIIDWPMNIGGKPNFSLKENMLSFNHRNGMPISLSWAQLYNRGVSTQYSTKKPRASASSKAPRMRMPLLAAYWLLHLKHWCLSLEQFTTSRLPNGRK